MNITGLLLIIILILLLVLRVLFSIYHKRELLDKKISVAQSQLVGTRKKQEDSLATIKRDDKLLAVIADGMGGLDSGEKASNLAVETFLEEFTRTYNFNSLQNFLIKTAYLANQRILNQVEDNRAGTTLLVVIIEDDKCQWLSVGDSNLFIYRDKLLKEINQKHTYRDELKKAYRAGEITRAEMLNHPKKNMLTSYLGHEDFNQFEINQSPLEFNKDDRLLLCSDGVTDALATIELENVFDQRLNAQQSSDLIINQIREKELSNQDNATVVIID